MLEAKLNRDVGAILGRLAGALFYVAFACYSGLPKVLASLRVFAWSTALYAVGLAAFNYFLRYLKWELYLRRLGIRVPFVDSITIFLSGFSLTVTPGKVGEVLKSYLLRESHGVLTRLCDEPPTQEQEYCAVQSEERLRSALEALPLEQCEVLKLAFFEEHSHSEIAERLGLPLGTVKSRIRRAAARLRSTLDELV